MPRQRKPQSGVARAAGRVANTTTSLGGKDIANTNPTVYRIPSGGKNRIECPAPLSEVGGVSPISVRREGNIFYVSLPEENLKSAIERMDNLDLSNVTVTLETVNGPLTIEGSITVNGDITGQAINGTDATFDSVTATTGTITSLSSTSIDADSIEADTSSLGAATADSLTTTTLTVTEDGQFNGTLEVDGISTLALANITEGNVDVLNATTGNIASLAVTEGATISGGLAADNATITGDASIGGGLSVLGASSLNTVTTSGQANLDSAIVQRNLLVRGATTTETLNVNGATSLGGNASIAGNLSVSGNETVSGNLTLVGDGIFNRNISVAGDAAISDDLSVAGGAHLAHAETTGSVAIGGSLRVTGAIDGANGASITGQLEADTARIDEVIADEIRVNEGLYLTSGAEAPDFVLQDEKGANGGVAPLNACGKIDTEYLPNLWTSAWVKLGTGSFNNSNTAVVNDPDITSDCFVDVSNYQDIIGDPDEIISEGKLTLVSNVVETGSFKYIVVKPFSGQSGCECA